MFKTYLNRSVSLVSWLIPLAVNFHLSAAVASPQENAPLIKDLSENIEVLKRPVYVWHWFNSKGRNPIWSQQMNVDDPAAYNYIARMSKNFFKSLCPLNSGELLEGCENLGELSGARSSMYGPGLYMATDPVVTEWYGGGAGWVLVRMSLPKGFRIWDLSRTSNELSNESMTLLKSWGCHLPNGKWSLIRLGADNGTREHRSSDQCLLEVRKLLKEDLKIQAIAYRYKGADFPECLAVSQGQKHKLAFVISSVDGIDAADVRVFNSQTKESTDERRLIQSLFYYAEKGRSELFRQMAFPSHPSHKFSEYISCAANRPQPGIDCGIKLCDAKASDCVLIPEPKQFSLAGLLMSKTNFPQSYFTPSKSPLWLDFDGTEIDPQIREWLKTNSYGCNE